MTTDADAFFQIDSAPSARFNRLGDSVQGTIRKPITMRQATEFMTDTPKVKADGTPEMMACIELQTTMRDPSIPDDDGVRMLYVEKFGQRKSISEALVQSGAKRLEVGGELFVQFVREEPSQKGNPMKVFVAKYTPPSAADAYFKPQTAPTTSTAAPGATTYVPAPNPLVDAARAAQQQAAPPPTAQQPPAGAPDPINDIKRVKELAALGMSPQQINQYLPHVSIDAIKTLLGV